MWTDLVLGQGRRTETLRRLYSSCQRLYVARPVRACDWLNHKGSVPETVLESCQRMYPCFSL